MNISEVEHIVGLSKKSIRYYEENGLLNPKRNNENDYRIFSEEDVRKLKIIKFFRELGVSIHDLRMLSLGELSVFDCMEEQLKKIKLEEKKYQSVKKMCEELSTTQESFWNIDITRYFHQMNTLNKEGFTMRKLKSNKRKKIQGAVFSSVVFGSFFLFLLGVISYFQFTEVDKLPWFIYAFFVLLFGLPIVGIIYNLVLRLIEIYGGEEDEASKY